MASLATLLGCEGVYLLHVWMFAWSRAVVVHATCRGLCNCSYSMCTWNDSL